MMLKQDSVQEVHWHQGFGCPTLPSGGPASGFASSTFCSSATLRLEEGMSWESVIDLGAAMTSLAVVFDTPELSDAPVVVSTCIPLG